MSDLPSSPRAPQSSSSLSAGDWLSLHAKKIAVAAVVLAVAVGGIYAYRQIAASTAQRAERAYFTAQAAQGSPEEQERALDGVIGAYRGTPAATQSAMLLAQLRYNRGAYAEGVAALARIDGEGGEFEASIDALIAAGLEGQGQFGEAAAKYREAAGEARFDIDRDGYLADAARAYRRAGNEAEAIQIWTDLAEDPAGGLAAEARVRLGELTAKPAGQS